MKAGIAASQRGDYRGASSSFAAALTEAQVFGEKDLRFAVTFDNLAETYTERGRYRAPSSRISPFATLKKLPRLISLCSPG